MARRGFRFEPELEGDFPIDGEGRKLSGEARLVAEVLRRAVSDYQFGDPTARAWFFTSTTTTTEPGITFRLVCEVLGLDPAWVRDKVRQMPAIISFRERVDDSRWADRRTAALPIPRRGDEEVERLLFPEE